MISSPFTSFSRILSLALFPPVFQAVCDLEEMILMKGSHRSQGKEKSPILGVLVPRCALTWDWDGDVGSNWSRFICTGLSKAWGIEVRLYYSSMLIDLRFEHPSNASYFLSLGFVDRRSGFFCPSSSQYVYNPRHTTRSVLLNKRDTESLRSLHFQALGRLLSSVPHGFFCLKSYSMGNLL